MSYEELFPFGDEGKEFIDELTDELGLGNVSGIKWTVGEGWDCLYAEAVKFNYFPEYHLYEPECSVEVKVDFQHFSLDKQLVSVDKQKAAYLTVEEAAEEVRKAAMAKLEKEAV